MPVSVCVWVRKGTERVDTDILQISRGNCQRRQCVKKGSREWNDGVTSDSEIDRKREREREGERGRERETERETDRETEREREEQGV